MSQDPEVEQPEEQDAPRKPRRYWRFGFRCLYLLCLLPVVFALVAALMLIGRDITAPTWIVQRLEARADTVLDGGALEFGKISLRISPDLHPTVRLVDMKLRDADGVLITRIPQAEGLISPRGLILQQDVLMQKIQVTGAQLNLRRSEDGSVAVAFAAGAGTVSRADSLPQLLDQLDAFFERKEVAALETIRADGVVVNFDDARAGRSWVVDGGAVSLDLRGGQTVLTGEFSVLSGRADVTRVALSFNSQRGSRAADIALRIDDAVARDIAAQTPALSWLQGVEATVSAAMRTTIEESGNLGPLNATLQIGQGVLRPNLTTEPLRFDAVKTYLTYDPARDHIRFDEIVLASDWGQLQATGDTYLREITGGLPRAFVGQLQFKDLSLNPASLYPAPLQIPQAAVDLRLRFDPFRIEVGQFTASDDQSRLSGAADVTATDAGWKVSLDAKVDAITPQKIVSYWPHGAKPRTRDWVATNIAGGTLTDAVVALRVNPEQPAAYAVGFGFQDADVRFMRRMPLITQAKGVASIIDKRFALSLDDGILTPPQGGPLRLAGSQFTIDELGLRNPPASVDLIGTGSLTSVLSVLNQPPLNFMDKANRSVTLADGRAAVEGAINWPLKQRPTREEVRFDFTAELSRVRSNTLIPNRRVAASQLAVAANNNGLTINGPIQIGEAAMRGSWRQSFADNPNGRSAVQADVTLSQAFLDEFKIALPPGSVNGSAPGKLSLDLARGRSPQFELRSDLAGLGIVIPPLGFAKSQSSAGDLLIEGTLGLVPQVSNLALTAPGLLAQGRVSLTPQGQLEAASLRRLRVGDWLDAPVTLRGRGAGRPVGVDVAGGILDIRRARLGSAGGQGGPVTVALDRLQLTEGIALTGFRGDFDAAGGFSGQFRGRVNDSAQIQGAITPRDGRSAIRIQSADAGAVGRAAGFMRNAVGGTLDLLLLPAPGAGSFDGTLAIRDLRVREAPTMAALLDAISVVGLLQQLDGQGISFETVDARFRLTPAQVILAEASAVGPGLGISLDGIYTLASKQLDFQGVVSPFYLVNSIGSFLTRRGEGLIGFNFNIAGNADAPQVTVNPLSAFTPGMFREIFRRAPPEITQ